MKITIGVDPHLESSIITILGCNGQIGSVRSIFEFKHWVMHELIMALRVLILEHNPEKIIIEGSGPWESLAVFMSEKGLPVRSVISKVKKEDRKKHLERIMHEGLLYFVGSQEKKLQNDCFVDSVLLAYYGLECGLTKRERIGFPIL